MGKFDQDLPQRPANYVPLTPLSFLARSADVYPNRTAVVYSAGRYDYRTFYERCRRFASALSRHGVQRGDTVAVMAPNSPPMLEAHFGVPMGGAVLNAINSRLDAGAVAPILEHGEARVLIADDECSEVVGDALARLEAPPELILVGDADRSSDDALDYEAFLCEGDPKYAWPLPQDEWDAISLNYTSGTTGNPKGVVCHHRGAYLAALGNSLQFRLGDDSVYLWTLPMFHCNGWSYTWAVTAAGGIHVCLRAVDPAEIFRLIAEEGVTHMCGAPVVLNMLINAPRDAKRTFPGTVKIATGGAAPPSAVIASMKAMGFEVTHLYGLTESYGPSAVCVWQPDWDALDGERQAVMMGRQGVRMPNIDRTLVCDPETLTPVPADGETIGELNLRGNTIMKGYLKNPEATEEAFAGDWYHTGDLGVVHPDGYVEIKDRAKDVIISGGENISSLEVEEILYRHESVLAAAVVARPDPKWGETPCAFVTLRPDAGEVSADDIIGFCRENMARFKVPKTVVFLELPMTPTGKVQKNLLRNRARELD